MFDFESYNLNHVLFKKVNKIFIENNEDKYLDDYFKKNLNTSFKYDFMTYNNHTIGVESCNLLNCIVNVNSIQLKFENGVLINNDDAKGLNDPLFVEKVEKTVSHETEKILEKLKLPLTLNENVMYFGYCLDIDIIKNIALWDRKDLEELFTGLKRELSNLTSRSYYELPFKNFPTQCLYSCSLLNSYNTWHSILKCSDYNKDKIPFISNSDSKKSYNVKKLISIIDRKGYINVMVDLMKKPYPFSSIDIFDLKILFRNISSNEFLTALPDIIKVKYNLKYISSNIMCYLCYNDNYYKIFSYKITKLYEKTDVNVDDVYELALILKDDFNSVIGYGDEEIIKYNFLLMSLLNICKDRYENILKNRYEWARLRGYIYPKLYLPPLKINLLRDSFPEVARDLIKIEKQNVFNKIFLTLRNKFIIDNPRDFNESTKISIENEIQKDEYLSSLKYKINVDTCNLLYSSLTIKNGENSTKIEFENGNLINSKVSIDEAILKRIQMIISKQTKKVSKKIYSFLSHNDILLMYGNCIDIKLALKLLFFDDLKMYGFFNNFYNLNFDGRNRSDYKKLYYHSDNNSDYDLNDNSNDSSNYSDNDSSNNFDNNSDNYSDNNYDNDSDNDTDNDFDNNSDNDSENYKYINYCKWLYSLECSKCDKNLIPMSYKINFEKIPNIDGIKMVIEHTKLRIISDGEEDEFIKIITNMISSVEAISETDLSYLKSFIEYEENYIKYIPKRIPNKENLAKIVKIMIDYFGKELPIENILPLFNNVNDVLKLAFELSKTESNVNNNSRTKSNINNNLKKGKFKSFSNSERRLLMALLNNCKNRYEDIMKHKTIWARLCERIHPNKFKKIYPDLVNDLLGSYQFIGNKENKRIRKEYQFYKKLYELDDRLQMYKNEINQFIEVETKRSKMSAFYDNYSIENIIKICSNYNQCEKYGKIEKNWKWIERRKYTRRIYCSKKLYGKFLFKKPLQKSEHDKLLVEFKNLKEIPDNLKNYVNQYIISLSGIAFNSLLTNMNWQHYQNIRGGFWKHNENNVNIYRKYDDYISYSTNTLHSLTNIIIPTLNRNLIEKRLKELQPIMTKLHEQDSQYQKERQSLDSKYVNLIKNKKVVEAARLISNKPGVFSRHLDEMISKCENYDSILTIFERIAPKTSVKVLLSVKGYFQRRHEKLLIRSFYITKTNITKSKMKNNKKKENNDVIYYSHKVKEPLPEDLCKQIVRICDQALILHFENSSKLKNVYIDPMLDNIMIPFNIRNESKSLQNFTKGSRISLSFNNITEKEKKVMIEETENRLNSYIKLEEELYKQKKQLEIDIINYHTKSKKHFFYNHEIEMITEKLEKINKKIERTKKELNEKKNYPIGKTYNKIRLYLCNGDFFLDIFDENFNFLSLINKYNSNDYNIYYNDDKNRDNYKYFDIDIENILSKHGRYIVVNTYNSFREMTFGWMEIEYLNSENSFDPLWIRQSLKINNKENGCPVILDCKTHEFIWIDYYFPLDYFPNFVGCYNKYQRNRIKFLAIYNLYLKYRNKIEKSNEYQLNNDEFAIILEGVNRNNSIYYKSIATYLKTVKNYNYLYNLNYSIKQSLLFYYIKPIRITMSELINLHVQARDGILIENEDDLQEGDYAFVPYNQPCEKEKVNYISCNQFDVILSEFMRSNINSINT